jgi:glycosyltransferase involved in cell wall biosynthesis
MQPMFYLSSTYVTRFMNSPRTMGHMLGRANYSYSIAMSKFMVALKEEEFPVRELSAPSIFPAPPELPLGGRAVHLAFYPPEDLRLLKHSINILVFAWEFSTLRTDDMLLSSHAFSSHVRMMETADAVWTPSRYAADVMRAASNIPIEVIPAPIRSPVRNHGDRARSRAERRAHSLKVLNKLEVVSLAVFPRHQSQASEKAFADRALLSDRILSAAAARGDGVVYLTILNPHDARKGLKESVEAFSRFSQQRNGAVWIIKTASHADTLETINTRLFTHQLARESDMIGQYFNNNILICNAPLSEDEMSALYALADFYLCTSHAEGQNFPLQESMAMGVVPISVRHTAMNDYIDADNAIVIASEEQALPPSIARKYGLSGAKWFGAQPRDVYEALNRSVDLGAGEYDRLSEAAASTIDQQYSGSIVCSKILAALQ